MRAVFRCDGGIRIGAGHLARCLTLANGLAQLGWRCKFLVNPEATQVFPRLARSEHDVGTLRNDELLSLTPVTDCRADLLVVDHYELGSAFESAARETFTIVMAIDDLPDRIHSCDILLNQNEGARGDSASQRAVERLLLGRQFALLGPEYSAYRPDALARRRKGSPVERLLVCFGASDPKNYCGRAVEAVLESSLQCRIDIAVSQSSPNADLLRALASRLGGDIELHFDTAQMPELMAKADLSIGAAGATTWERCCLGLPAIVYRVADNQARIAEALSQHDAAWVMGDAASMNGGELIKALETLSSDHDRRSQMAEMASSMADGEGVSRVTSEVQGMLIRRNEAANLS